MRRALILTAFLACTASGSTADVHHDLAPFDRNHDGLLDHDELSAYFRAHDSEIRKLSADEAKKALETRINDILLASPQCTVATCTTVAIPIAERRIEKRMSESDKPEHRHF